MILLILILEIILKDFLYYMPLYLIIYILKFWIFFFSCDINETAYAKAYLGTEEHPILLVNLTAISKCIFIINSF